MSQMTGCSLLIAVLASGCSTKQTPNEENFAAAITRNFEKNGVLCLGLRAWPIDVDLVQRSRGVEAPLQALESVGLLRGEWLGTPDALLDPDARVRRYTLTAAAAPYVRQQPASRYRVRTGSSDAGRDVCWGRKALDAIVDWSGPMQLSSYRTADVTYRYRIAEIAAWASLPQVQEAFPEIRRHVQRAGTERRQMVVLTPTGWEVKKYEE